MGGVKRCAECAEVWMGVHREQNRAKAPVAIPSISGGRSAPQDSMKSGARSR